MCVRLVVLQGYQKSRHFEKKYSASPYGAPWYEFLKRKVF